MKTNICIGDSRELIKKMPNESIDCVMTSPPYWGLRDYGHPDQLGQEETPEEFIEKLVLFFYDVKDKLKNEGTCWVNLGDTYLPNKSAGMIPERFAWSMVEHGWILRNKIIWHKPNHMPESVVDRFTKSYEYLFFFVKQSNYNFDLDSIRIPHTTHEKRPPGVVRSREWDYDGKYKGNEMCEDFGSPRARTQRKVVNEYVPSEKGKNPGDVWQINTKPYTKAHFAVFPLELVRQPILSGCPVGGHVLDPFGGSGTVAEFCRNNDRECTIFELNPEYKPLIEERSMVKIPSLLDWNDKND